MADHLLCQLVWIRAEQHHIQTSMGFAYVFPRSKAHPVSSVMAAYKEYLAAWLLQPWCSLSPPLMTNIVTAMDKAWWSGPTWSLTQPWFFILQEQLSQKWHLVEQSPFSLKEDEPSPGRSQIVTNMWKPNTYTHIYPLFAFVYFYEAASFLCIFWGIQWVYQGVVSGWETASKSHPNLSLTQSDSGELHP